MTSIGNSFLSILEFGLAFLFELRLINLSHGRGRFFSDEPPILFLGKACDYEFLKDGLLISSWIGLVLGKV